LISGELRRSVFVKLKGNNWDVLYSEMECYQFFVPLYLTKTGWNKRSGSTSRLPGNNKSPLYSRALTKNQNPATKTDCLKQEKEAFIQQRLIGKGRAKVDADS